MSPLSDRPLRIAGAGLAGLLAAHAWPSARVFEVSPAPRVSHRALLRFRSNVVAHLTGIDFKPVTVRKGLWFEGAFAEPSILTANLYASKTLGQIVGERSVWKLEAAERWIAPEDFYEQLVMAVGSRIEWSTNGFDLRNKDPIISTAPLGATLKEVGIAINAKLGRRKILVERFRIPNCSVYQTIYFPDLNTRVYRASITGDLLIIERSPVMLEGKGMRTEGEEIDEVLQAFGIEQYDFIDSGDQHFGKIIPLEDGMRRALLHRLSEENNVFSLGRFATWRNILLDDVVQDIAVIRRLLRATSYEKKIFSTR